ncbi:MAG TPA: RNase adapter RapZ [Oligoflexia bacterium]|nr:RNase adapter RapZ [Oligoflexia bacterium]HMR24863.1 RNase adapter RapZ [Oligoflexia bacterium]
MKPKESKKLNLIIVSGLSGAGKSTVIKSLEDIGFYCIDNLPVQMFDQCVSYFKQSKENIENIALVIDARESLVNIKPFADKINQLRLNGEKVKLLFLQADKESLLKRFRLTRRRHPVDKKGDIVSAIEEELRILQPLKMEADQVIDTSAYNVHELKRHCMEIFSSWPVYKNMFISVLSFGFKHGLPHNADLVFDVRFLNNPYFQDHLKKLSGLDEAVKLYVMQQVDAQKYLDYIQDLLKFSIPKYEQEPKAYLTIAIGCTGGQHRSVAMAEQVYKFIAQTYKSVSIRHRDIMLDMTSA